MIVFLTHPTPPGAWRCLGSSRKQPIVTKRERVVEGGYPLAKKARKTKIETVVYYP